MQISKRIMIILLLPILLLLQSPHSLASTASQVNTKKVLKQAEDLDPKVLKLALKAYDKAEQEGKVKKPYLTVVDYSMPSTEKRMWVIDLENNTVPYHTLVSHGSGSGGNLATNFSNQAGTHASSIGVYETGNTYVGKHGTSVNLYGLEPGFNSNAYSRRIVVHGADYVSESVAQQLGRLGRSWGCFALNTSISKAIMNKIKDGALLFAYYPSRDWLSQSKYLA